jgi:hypothetical protein
MFQVLRRAINPLSPTASDVGVVEKYDMAIHNESELPHGGSKAKAVWITGSFSTILDLKTWRLQVYPSTHELY